MSNKEITIFSNVRNWDMSWVLVPKIPDDYSVEFAVLREKR